MNETLFMMPIKSGKKDDYIAFINECLGSRKAEYEDLLQRYGLNRTRIWLHEVDGKDYAMFVHNMDDDAAEKLASWSSSTHPFDQWFDQHLRDCYDFDGLDNAPPQPILLGEALGK